jgi:hypothetical protein
VLAPLLVLVGATACGSTVVTSQRLTAAVHSARDAIAIAEPLARRRVESAQVGSVVIHVDAESQSVASIDVGVHAYRRGLLGGTRLWSGFVTIDNRLRQAEFREGGEYGAEQLAQLSALPGSGFPPEPIDVDSIVLDAGDVIRLAADRLASKGAALRPGGQVQLLLRKMSGRLEWHFQHEQARGLAVYTLVADAGSGEVTYERLPPSFGGR